MLQKKSANVLRREQRIRLYNEQEGKCYYCFKLMRLMPSGYIGALPPDACTREHLDDKYSPERGKHKGERRIVAACHKCNAGRAAERTNALTYEERVIRSRGEPKCLTD